MIFAMLLIVFRKLQVLPFLLLLPSCSIGYPCSIIIAGMLFFSEEKNQSKAQMYVCSGPEFQDEYMLHELRWAGVDVDGMLKMAAEQNINQL